MRKYTFHDWLEGKLILKYDYFIPSGAKPTFVDWDDFNDEDINIIKRKQEEIFNERVTNLLEKYKSEFNKEIKASKDSEGHCTMTVHQITAIFTDVMPQASEFVNTQYWNVVFTYGYLCEIKESYKNSILKGKLDYTFINSPKIDYQRQEENPQIYVHSMFLFKKWIESLLPQQPETKTNKLSQELGNYGFFDLPKVKQLSEPNKQSLVKFISEKNLPYNIAMFEYLEFLKHLKAEHFKTDYTLFNAVAKWFDVGGRAVKGNIYVLNKNSQENRTRYTADQQKKTVQKDYEKLK